MDNTSSSSSSCFICFDEFQHYPESPSVSQLPVHLATTRGIVNLLIQTPNSELETLESKVQFKESQFCTSCTVKLEEIHEILVELEKLNVKLSTARNALIGQIETSFNLVAHLSESELPGNETNLHQMLREKILQNFKNDRKRLPSKGSRTSELSVQLVQVPAQEKLKTKLDLDIENPEPEELITGDLDLDSPNLQFLQSTHNMKTRHRFKSRESKSNKSSLRSPTSPPASGWSGRKRKTKSIDGGANREIKIEPPSSPSLGIDRIDIEMDDDTSDNQHNQIARARLQELPKEDDGPTSCSKCHKEFLSKAQFRRHNKGCKRQGLFPCKFCGNKYTQSYLGQHIQRIHSDKSKLKSGRNLECPECGKIASDLDTHFARLHQAEFTCTICDKKFIRYLEYNYHKTTHSELNLPTVKCDICDKIFLTNEYLQKHVRTMHVHRKFGCEQCSYSTGRSAGLREHIRRVHEKTSTVACELCDSVLASPYHLKLHLLRHTGEEVKKYSCGVCSKKFPLIGKLRDHEAAIHGIGQIQHVCFVCGKVFPVKNYLYIHLRSHETPEEKEARKMKAKLAKELREKGKKPVLRAKGRPKVQSSKNETIIGNIDDIDVDVNVTPQDSINCIVDASVECVEEKESLAAVAESLAEQVEKSGEVEVYYADYAESM